MWEWVLWSGLLYGVSVFGAVHALLYKRDSRSAALWIVTCLGLPGLGALAYSLFGVNRIRRRARKLRLDLGLGFGMGYERSDVEGSDAVGDDRVPRKYRLLARIGGRVTRRPLLDGNSVEPLFDGEQAYARMLAAIDSAHTSVRLSSYIFHLDGIGMRFVDALVAARARRVAVNVMLDGVGQWYSRARTGDALEASGVSVARFLPPSLTRLQVHINLRNHRKVLVVDDELGFTGGMNIGDQHLTADASVPDRVHDVHYAVRGPVVRQLAQVFADDWEACARESLAVGGQSSAVQTLGEEALDEEALGEELCRCVASGPDKNVEKLNWILIGALAGATHRVRIMTPYFLPPRELLTALQAAALRGVEVELVLPGLNNLAYMHWATRALLWEVLEFGGRVYYAPAPFRHTKLLIIDDGYVVLGSSNLDARSLRLNFELDLEVYGERFAARMVAHFDDVRATAREVTLDELDGRPLLTRIRDAAFWLFSPYL